MSAPVPAVAVDRLVKVYKNVPAVSGISFALAPGSMTALLGGNGAGKTTTIAMIMGLLEPTSGSVSVLGAAMPRQRYRVLHRMNFESPYVEMPRRLTVRQNLEVFARLYGVADIAARIRTLAQELDLGDLLDRQTGKLSSGQRTRAALAKALLNRPEVLLLDEPTASLDPDTADWVRACLERYRRGGGAARALRPGRCARASAAPAWKRSFSTWRAAGAMGRRSPHERERSGAGRDLARADRPGGAALAVS